MATDPTNQDEGTPQQPSGHTPGESENEIEIEVDPASPSWPPPVPRTNPGSGWGSDTGVVPNQGGSPAQTSSQQQAEPHHQQPQQPNYPPPPQSGFGYPAGPPPHQSPYGAPPPPPMGGGGGHWGFQPNQPPPPTGPRRPYAAGKPGRSPLGMLIVIAVVVGLGYLLFNGGSSTPRNRTTYPGGSLQESIVNEGTDNYRIAVVNIEGVILETGGGGLFESFVSPVQTLREALERIDRDNRYRGLLLRINSPGGGLTASDVLYKMLTEYVDRWKRIRGSFTLGVLFGDIAASGGYYIAAPADRIVAQPTTITGSIGVLIQGYNFHGLMEQFGIEDATVTSAPYKTLGSSTSEMRPFEMDRYQTLLDEFHGQFVDAVYEGRRNVLEDLTRERVEGWANGLVYSATEAEALGLIDDIGYDEDILGWMRGQIGPNANPTIVELYPRPPSLDLFGLDSSGAGLDRAEIEERIRAAIRDEVARNVAGPRVWAVWPDGVGESPIPMPSGR